MLATATRSRASVCRALRPVYRSVSTLPSNPHIYVFPDAGSNPKSSILSLLPSDPPNRDICIGSTTEIPPTPESLTQNPHFLEVLQSVFAEHATQDPDVQAQAKAFASHGGSTLGSGGAFFPSGQAPQTRTRSAAQRKRDAAGAASRATGGGGGAGGGGAGGASAQGGMGGGGVGGFVHVSDRRNPPDWGRIAYPEDIFGSLEVDGEGRFVGERGQYQRSGTYRMCTNEGILNLTPYLRGKLVDKLEELERSLKR